MIDRSCNKGVDEPYRMFHSRAEFRLLLREDNAEYRLLDKAFKLGLISTSRYERFLNEKNLLRECLDFLFTTKINIDEPDNTHIKSLLHSATGSLSLYDIIKRPEIQIDDITPYIPSFPFKVIEQAIIRIKYEGYIKKQEEDVKKMQKYDKIKIPDDIDYSKISGLRKEYIEKLNKVRPNTLGQALRIQGMNTCSCLSSSYIYKVKLPCLINIFSLMTISLKN